MDVDTGSDTFGSDSMNMTMGLSFHFTPYDQLWFSGWAPASSGAMVGACIGLVLLAMLERWIAALRGLSEIWWKRRTDTMLARRFEPLPTSSSSSTSQTPSIEKKNEEPDCCDAERAVPSLAPLPSGFPQRNRSTEHYIPPFIMSHDIPRGVLQVVHAALAYTLMLAVMTLNAGYFLAILCGLGVGETLFGRFANHGGHVV